MMVCQRRAGGQLGPHSRGFNMKFLPKGALLAVAALGSTSLGLAHGAQALLAAKAERVAQCPSVDQCGLSLTSFMLTACPGLTLSPTLTMGR